MAYLVVCSETTVPAGYGVAAYSAASRMGHDVLLCCGVLWWRTVGSPCRPVPGEQRRGDRACGLGTGRPAEQEHHGEGAVDEGC